MRSKEGAVGWYGKGLEGRLVLGVHHIAQARLERVPKDFDYLSLGIQAVNDTKGPCASLRTKAGREPRALEVKEIRALQQAGVLLSCPAGIGP